MKRLLVLSVLFSLVCFFNTAIAQQLKVITLDQDEASFAIPLKMTLFQGDTLQFKSVNGDFSIYIQDAYQFFRIREDNLEDQVSSSGTALSGTYLVRRINSTTEVTISVYCISNNSWPDAPPRIIIVSQ